MSLTLQNGLSGYSPFCKVNDIV